ncbi:MAG TPA: dienelactone hydrolase family protein [Stellaceae bacterium]|nr:dienelactone hydrolase family protein [Stellaceae bacterium]
MDRSIRDRIDHRVVALYDDFTHRHLDRRLFMERLTALVGATAAVSMMALLRSNYALAETVKADDPRLAISRVTYPGSSGEVKAYLARPKGDARLPAVIVIHQNRGLNPHIEDVARRLALAGYVALAIDFLSPFGGTPADEDQAMKDFAKVQKPVAVADAVKAVAYLRGRPDVTGKVGVVGFCWGGGIVNDLATASPDLTAGVAYYGVAPDLDKVANIKAALLLHYGALDDRVNATRPAYEEALKKAGTSYTAYAYEGAYHGFNDDTGARYDAAAAALAWQRTLDFLNAKLKA